MRNIFLKVTLALSDVILLTISVFLAFLLRFDGTLNFVLEYKEELIIFLPISLVIKFVTYYFYKLYTSLWKYASITELIYIICAIITSNAIISTMVFFTEIMIPRGVLGALVFTDAILIGGLRLSFRVLRRLISSGKFKNDYKRVMIVGAGDAGAIIVKELRNNPKFKLKPIVIIDDDGNKNGRNIMGTPIVGTTKQLSSQAEKYKIEIIIIAIPSATKSELNRIYRECSKTDCDIRLLPSVGKIAAGENTIRQIKEISLEDLLGRDVVNFELNEVRQYTQNKVVFVTGGGGSIGSELCRQISTYDPEKLCIIDNYENNGFAIYNELKEKFPNLKIKLIIANVREKDRLEQIFEKERPNVIFHAAAHKHVPLMEKNPCEAIKNNIFATINLVSLADEYNVDRFVFISTDKAVNPTNVMGATKRVAEMIIQAINRISETEFVAVRFGNVLGSNGSVVPIFMKQIKKGGPITLTHKDVTRFFMTIPEAVQLVLEAGAMAQGGEIFVLDMGEPVKIYDLAVNLIKLSGLEPEKDIDIKITGLRPGEKLYEEILLEEEGLESTKSKKIYIAKPKYINWEDFYEVLGSLKESINESDDEIRANLKRIVPNYNYERKNICL